MPQTLVLPDDLADALSGEALRLGMSLPDYAIRLHTSTCPSTSAVRNGTGLVAFWQAEGLVGSRSDIGDSQVQARPIAGASPTPRSMTIIKTIHNGGHHMSTSTVKEEARRLVEQLPDDATWEDLQYQIYFRQAVQAGLADSHAGRVVPLAEAKRQFLNEPPVDSK